MADAIEIILRSKGRVILTGMGKSGHIARKIAATLASTGTPAMFVHPAEASHGDLGMITKDDVIIVVSNSGESPELRDILRYSRRFAVPLIAITAQGRKHARERGRHRAAAARRAAKPARSAWRRRPRPCCSSRSAMRWRWRCSRTRASTPASSALSSGRQLGAAPHPCARRHAQEIATAAVPRRMPMSEALLVMTSTKLRLPWRDDEDGRLIGIVTDGDLRRHMSRNLIDLTVGEVMTPAPKTIAPDALASEALECSTREDHEPVRGRRGAPPDRPRPYPRSAADRGDLGLTVPLLSQ